jgi:hypothetical protein
VKKKDLAVIKFTDVVIYPIDDGKYQIALNKGADSIWLSLKELADLYQTSVPNISMHIRNILLEEELDRDSTVKNYLTVQTENARQVQRNIVYYNLEMVLAIGYRVRSTRGTQFRIWATQHLSEYLKKGFILDDERLKGSNTQTDYFDELIARIRDIRASEKRAYLRVRELFSMAVDYNPKSKAAQIFFATMQNKMHYAATGKTAAEIVAERADADKANMGLTNWKGQVVRKADVAIAKNYLEAVEIDILNRIVVMWLDAAEFRVLRRKQIYTREWEIFLDKFLIDNELPVLEGAGRISHEKAKELAEREYSGFERSRRQDNEADAEEKYLEDLRSSIKLVAARRKKQ